MACGMGMAMENAVGYGYANRSTIGMHDSVFPTRARARNRRGITHDVGGSNTIPTGVLSRLAERVGA